VTTTFVDALYYSLSSQRLTLLFVLFLL